MDEAKQAVEQEKLLPFLVEANSYPHRPRRVQLVQTHGSFVFIVPPFVYKVKKPVNFGFLDFSTLEKRRYFCEREVELNRRLSPNIYLGVVPISKIHGGLTIGEGDQVVEYAVKMRKLSDGHFLDELLKRGRVTTQDLDRIVFALVSFYKAQHPTDEIEEWGRVDHLKISTDENFRQTESFIGQTLSRPAYETIRYYTDEFYTRHPGLFESRLRDRWIRDCHGDLHLEHIHLTPRALHIYDCIEFNDRLRYIDVANDIAFLAMDLDFKARPDLAHYLTDKMAEALGDPRMGQIMDFYKCYRAYVRGKVESLHSVAHAAAQTEREGSAEQARRYFRLALQYTVAGSRPLVLVVMGRIASGKSTLAHALGEELGWTVFSSDRIRKEIAGFPLYERSSESAPGQLYSFEMTSRTYDRLLNNAIEEMAQNRSVILDATFAHPNHRKQLESCFGPKRVRCQFIEAQADDETVKQRLRSREGKPEEVSDARLDDFEALTSVYQPPRELAVSQLMTVPTNSVLEQTILVTLRMLAQAQLELEPLLKWTPRASAIRQ